MEEFEERATCPLLSLLLCNWLLEKLILRRGLAIIPIPWTAFPNLPLLRIIGPVLKAETTIDDFLPHDDNDDDGWSKIWENKVVIVVMSIIDINLDLRLSIFFSSSSTSAKINTLSTLLA